MVLDRQQQKSSSEDLFENTLSAAQGEADVVAILLALPVKSHRDAISTSYFIINNNPYYCGGICVISQ